MPGLKAQRRTRFSEWLIGIGFSVLAALAALALLAPLSWRTVLEERNWPLRSLDAGFAEIGDRSVSLQAFLWFQTSRTLNDQADAGRGRLGSVSRPEGVYRLSSEASRFALWFARQPEGPWLPVGGGRGIEGLVGAGKGVLAWGENVGRVQGTSAVWRDWPKGFKPTSVAPLSTGGYIAWNERVLYVARTLDAVPLGMPSPAPLTGMIEGIDQPGVVWLLAGSRARRYRLR